MVEKEKEEKIKQIKELTEEQEDEEEEDLEEQVEDEEQESQFDEDDFINFIPTSEVTQRTAPILELTDDAQEIGDTDTTESVEDIAQTAPTTQEDQETIQIRNYETPINLPDYESSAGDYAALYEQQEEQIERKTDRQIDIAGGHFMIREPDIGPEQQEIRLRTFQRTQTDMGEIQHARGVEDYVTRERELKKEKRREDKLPVE